MAKDVITEYDATANNNTVCGDVNIAENSALPSDMNNFAREIMSHLKEGLGSGTPLYVDQTNNRVGINKTPTVALDVSGDADLSGTLDVTGTVTAGAVAVDNITIDATEIDSTSALTLDSAGTISLDADSGSINLLDGGVTHAELINSSNDFIIKSSQSDKDIIFKGVDGISLIEAMRIDMSAGGNVGIGTSSPGTALSFDAGTNTILGLNFNASSGNGGSLQIRAGGGNGSGNSGGNLNLCSGTGTNSASVGNIIFGRSSGDNTTIAPDEEWMRITSSGHLLVGCTGLPSGGGGGAGFEAGQANGRTILQLGTTTTSQITVQRFYNPNGNVGEIKLSGSSTIYSTSSDYRLKENVTADWDATTRLKQLNPVRFNFIADADTTVDGFLAHEVQSVVPEAITGEKDAVDADGNPKYQGIDQSKLVPLLVKTIQELEARITALENGE